MSGEGTTTTILSEPTSNLDSPATTPPRPVSTNLPESDGFNTSTSTTTTDDESGEVGTLEWAQVIELQAFSDRKVWIEQKTRVRIIPHFLRVSS